MVYAPVLGTGGRNPVEVRVLFWAPRKIATQSRGAAKIRNCLGGGIGIRACFRSMFSQGIGSSSLPQGTMKKIITFEKFAKTRIDKFLMEEFFLNMEITRGEIIRQIKEGNILVDGKRVKPSYMLRTGDKIEINISEKEKDLVSNKAVKFRVIAQDENMIVINKPAGLQVHPSTRNETDTLVNGLLCKFPEIGNVGDAPKIRPGIVHRLDRGTSGVLIVARNQETYLSLKKKFKNREMRKKYWAIVYGTPEKNGIIDTPLARAADYKKQIIAGEKTRTKIRTAVTEYEALVTSDKFALLEVSPKTGRTHQIRVHLTSIGHPILGDEKYMCKKFAIDDNTKRLFLHAKSLEFEMHGKKYQFAAPLPLDFQNFLVEEGLYSRGLTERG
jgi:23S rRNA pseudouridine1911/1915/1917 synthase